MAQAAAHAAPPGLPITADQRRLVLQQVMSPNALAQSVDIDKVLGTVRQLQGQGDWQDWKSWMNVLLDHKGLHQPFIVVGKELLPHDFHTVLADITMVQVRQFTQEQTDEDDFRKVRQVYTAAARTTHTLLFAALSPPVRQHVRQVPRTDPYQVWAMLHSLFERETALSTRQRLARFLQIRMLDTENIQQFYTRVLNSAQDLRERNEAINESMLVNAIYGGLPKSFNQVQVVLEQDETLSILQIVERLRDFEEKTQDQGAGDNAGASDAFTARHQDARQGQATSAHLQGRGTEICKNFTKGRCHRGASCHYKHVQVPRAFQEKGEQGARACENCGQVGHATGNCTRPKVKCYSCGRPGHLAKFCRSKQPRAQDQAGVSHNSAATATTTEEAWVFSASAQDEWIVDSGATRHMVKDGGALSNVRPTLTQLHLADGTTRTITQVGNMELRCNGGGTPLLLKNVLLAPMLSKNLLSTAALDDEGYKVEQHQGRIKIFDVNNQHVASATRRGQLFALDYASVDNASAAAVSTTSLTQLWHRRLGHLPLEQLRAATSACTGISGIDGELDQVCEGCIKGKMHRVYDKEATNKSTTPGERICTDLQGPMQTTGTAGARYSMNFVDEASGYCWLFFLRQKSSAYNAMESFLNMMENDGKRVRYLRSDGGGEYTSGQVQGLLRRKGIKHEVTNPYSPHQNGKAERNNRSVMEVARCLLKHSGMPNVFWVEAMRLATWIRVRAPSRILNGKSPFEVWGGSKPNVKHLRVFGTAAYAHVPKEQRRKLDDKAKLCFLTGVTDSASKYQLWCPEDKRFVWSSDIIFNESLTYGQHQQRRETEFKSEDDGNEDGFDPVQSQPRPPIQLRVAEAPDLQVAPPLQVQPQPGPPPQGQAQAQDQEQPQGLQQDLARRSTRSNKGVPAPVLLQDEQAQERAHLTSEENGAADQEWCLAVINDEPTSYNEAINGNDKDVWCEAMQEEINALKANKTWELTELPQGRRAIRCRWIFKRKEDSNGNTTRFKARLVACGYTQLAGVDYNDTFSPTASFKTVRLLFALAAQLKLHLHQDDVQSAFLHAKLDEELYMEQPVGFVVPGQERRVCRLYRGIYGLKQASRAWYLDINATLLKLGFKKSLNDPCLYVLRVGNSVVFAAVFVDDIIKATNDHELLRMVEGVLDSKYKMTHLGQPIWCLQMRVSYDYERGVLKLDQELLANKVLKRFRMHDCKPASTPEAVGGLLDADNDSALKDMELVPYKSAVGALLYLAQTTRPDLAHAAGVVSRYAANPQPEHWRAVKRILRYLAGTRDHGITYTRTVGEPLLHGFADADWAGDLRQRRSTTGFVFYVAGGPVSWRSKLQQTVALSTTEAEYLAAGDATREALWLRSMLNELGLRQAQATIIYEDNQSCIALTLNPGQHQRTKHIDVRHHFIQSHVEEGSILLTYLCTEDMVADLLTKALATPRFNKLKARLLNSNEVTTNTTVASSRR